MPKNKLIEKEVDGVKEIMNLFYQVNPMLNWANRTYRKSAGEIIKKFGLEEAKQLAEAAISIQGQPFAPVITNPWELKEKLIKVKIFFDREKNGRGRIIKI